MGDNSRDPSRGLNFVDWKFCDILGGLCFAEKAKISEISEI